ncbi:serine hydrolase [Methylomonas methanica]|uniref:Peptidase S11 D-alanyl-D-alanine carboxypeptidase 1 n=1 Tax=Methylomonas methanica (strain DSM 25384 / MC09) TaxID=857087 RepID=G0A6C0_METMM|nr:serine hydrolase [Methylomonas methanica]AEG01748.1 peptidase S11 D-alanyl-D-alanine carboxypeptidase 1 [Methylomonas methanica MC09]
MSHGYRTKRIAKVGCFLISLTVCFPVLADSDADGIEDRFDNCIFRANPSQTDSDGDGFGDRCDADFDNNAFVNVADLAFFKSVFGTPSVQADFDKNGFVNVADLAYFKSLFGRAPGPAGDNVYPVSAMADAKLEAEARVTTRCDANNLATYVIEGELSMSGGSPGLRPFDTATITFSDDLGNSNTASAEDHHYSITLREATLGSIRQTQLSIQADGHPEILSANKTVQLAGCHPPAVPFDVFNGPTQRDLPPVFGTEPGKPNEVDIIHLGGLPEGPTKTAIVAAAGTGAGAKLYSFTLDAATHAPVFMKASDSFAGFDIKLLPLSGDLSPDLTVDPFVAALRSGDNLWLRTWQIAGDGSFTYFSGRGYGENAKVRVEAYAITQRVLDNGNYQVATPIRTDRGKLRFVTWLIDRNNGEVYGRYDSNDFGEPSADTELSVSHLKDGLFVVSYQNDQGRLANHYWRVDNLGNPVSAGSMVSGLNLRGTGSSVAFADAALNLPLLTDDFVTPVFYHDSALADRDDLRLYVWETRNNVYDFGSIQQPYLISHSQLDQTPDSLGVTLDYAPGLTSPNDAPPNVRAMLADDKVGDFNLNDGELFTQTAAGELTEVQMASVTKVMVLLLAVEAVNDGQVALTDVVEVSEGAGNVGGSRVGGPEGEGLVPGETQTLELLLQGMMLTSGNDAAAAIAEHVAKQSGGSLEDFIGRMNIRATELGMFDTTYWVPDEPFGGPGGGGTSTPEDQIKLWRFARDIPLFTEFAKSTFFYGCGSDPLGAEKCWSIDKFNDGGYPGMNGWKGGNGGFPINAYTTAMNGPFCIDSGCLIAESYRLDRPLIVGIQDSGNRWGDAARLWDFGFQSQFTPDKRGSGVNLGSTADFALDGVGDLTTASIHLPIVQGTVQVCSWRTLADPGFLTQNSCVELDVSGLAAGPDRAVPTKIDGAVLGTTFADADYIVGHRDLGGFFRLALWRVGNLEP